MRLFLEILQIIIITVIGFFLILSGFINFRLKELNVYGLISNRKYLKGNIAKYIGLFKMIIGFLILFTIIFIVIGKIKIFIAGMQ